MDANHAWDMIASAPPSDPNRFRGLVSSKRLRRVKIYSARAGFDYYLVPVSILLKVSSPPVFSICSRLYGDKPYNREVDGGVGFPFHSFRSASFFSVSRDPRRDPQMQVASPVSKRRLPCGHLVDKNPHSPAKGESPVGTKGFLRRAIVNN